MADHDNALYARATEVLETEVEGVTLLMHVENWNYFELNAVSSAIWALLESPKSLDAIVSGLERQFDIDHETCMGDTRGFLDDLIAEGVITRG
ncbi:MAG: PqqD family protein [Proteobacteria bacterium]|nr:PqqD family protein [Pseudomonadota bacterium]